ncbi:hypothetical protein [Thalassospira sp.]|uniref:hypothetical protein n=1 Tax=Thalassospira sp. TaxID=1912094 RepID=UPI0027332E32|nr:hypothetical protein [Thalassospira sp.]MDP2699038.1 hypothetical protein [Thalassospira sp.]
MQMRQADDMMTLWQATGGAVDGVVAQTVHTDEGQSVSAGTSHPPMCVEGDEALQMAMGTGHFPMCVEGDEALKMAMGTGHFPMCVSDEGHQLAGTFRPPMCIAQ